MHYLLSQSPLSNHPEMMEIDGAILQGSASDREALLKYLPPTECNDACRLAQKYVDEGRGNDIVPFSITTPSFGNSPFTARRFLSLASPGLEHEGEDDYFSSDLPDERSEATFGKLGKATTKGLRIAF